MKTVKEWLAEQLKKESEETVQEQVQETVKEETVQEQVQETVKEEQVQEEQVQESELMRELKEVKEQLNRSLELNGRMVHMLEPKNNAYDIDSAFNSFDRYHKKGEK